MAVEPVEDKVKQCALIVLPDWAVAVLRETDESLSPEARRELLIEGGVVLTRP